MENVLTETPPPTRFFQEDLDNFATPSPPLPSPFLLLNPNPNPKHLGPSTLLIAISPSSLSLLHRIPNKTLIGTLILPEIPLSTNFPIDIYAVELPSSSAVLVAVQCHVSAGRSRAVAKLIFREFQPEKVLVLDSINGENYRGRLAVDEAMIFKLETAEERRRGDKMVKGVEYLASGSVMDGLGAAVIGECQMRRKKGTMVVTWPENGREVVVVLRDLMRDLGFDGEDEGGFTITRASSRFDSDLYT